MRKGTPVRINGVDYPSMGAAARALKLSPSTVAGWLDRGATGPIGSRRYGGPRRPITLGGVRYESLVEAADGLGVSYSYFTSLLHRPDLLEALIQRRSK